LFFAEESANEGKEEGGEELEWRKEDEEEHV